MKFSRLTLITPLAAAAALASCVGPMNHDKDKDDAADHQHSTSRYLVDDSNNPAAPPSTHENALPQTSADGGPLPPESGTPLPPKTTAPAPTTTNASAPPVPPPPSSSNQYPYGKPVPGKKGFVTSPYDDKAGMIDVRDFSPGQKVRDPYTNKIFLVP